MNGVEFDFANLHDLENIQSFINTHWSEHHIYSTSNELFLREFLWLKRPDKLTIAMARDESGILLGIFCFKFFNYSELPDLAGGLWKVTSYAEKKYQMIGVRLQQYVIKNVPHRFYSAPGPNIQTKNTNKMLRLQWNDMKQYYAINPYIKDYKLIKFLPHNILKDISSKASHIQLKRVVSVDQLLDFNFNAISNIVPFKDKKYIENRFFDYPFYKYDVFLVYKKIYVYF